MSPLVAENLFACAFLPQVDCFSKKNGRPRCLPDIWRELPSWLPRTRLPLSGGVWKGRAEAGLHHYVTYFYAKVEGSTTALSDPEPPAWGIRIRNNLSGSGSGSEPENGSESDTGSEPTDKMICTVDATMFTVSVRRWLPVYNQYILPWKGLEKVI